MSLDTGEPMTAREADDGQRELAVRVGLGLFATEAELDQLIAMVRQIDVERGQVLFERDRPVTNLFQLVAGEVELAAPAAPTWTVRQRGAVGLLDFLRSPAHARTAVATAPSQLLQLDAADYRDYLEDNYEVGQRIREGLCAELTTSLLAMADPTPFLGLSRGEADPAPRSYLEIEIPVVERLVLLSRLGPFRGASVQALANLAQRAVERRLVAGDVIATAGVDPRVISVLVEGAVELELPSALKVERRGQGFVAHLEELTVGPRRTTATASDTSLVLDIDRDDLADRVEEHFELGMTLLAFAAAEQARINDLARECRLA